MRPPRLLLHVGTPRTGTTFLQRALWNNRDRLARVGVHYPGDDPHAQLRAALDLQDARIPGLRDPQIPGAWTRLVDQARALEGTVIFSAAGLSGAQVEHVDRAMRDLAFAEVHLVCTARALTRQVPSCWQDLLRHRGTVDLDQYVAALRSPGDDELGLGRAFWHQHDVAALLSRWASAVPADRVHVLTVAPDARRNDLWRRFTEVLGVAPTGFDLAGLPLSASLGAAESDVLLRLNRALAAEIGWPLYHEMVRNHLVTGVLASRIRSPRISLRPEDVAWLTQRAEAMVGELKAQSYDVVGALDDLLNDPGPPPAISSLEVEAALATEALASILLRVWRLRRGMIKP